MSFFAQVDHFVSLYSQRREKLRDEAPGYRFSKRIQALMNGGWRAKCLDCGRELSGFADELVVDMKAHHQAHTDKKGGAR